MTPHGIEGANVFITGASSGIGAALAEQAAARGAALVGLLARNEERLGQVQRGVETHGAEAVLLSADVTDRERLSLVCSEFLERHGPPDFLFVNAGIGRIEQPKQVDPDLVSRIMAVNFQGAVNVLSLFLPAMEKRGGRVVVTSSIAAYRGLPAAAAYSASKAALDRFVEALRIQYLGTDLSFLLVEPGFVATPMTEKNPFPMPFLLSPSNAATRILDAAESRRRRQTFPLPMALALKTMALLPDSLYDVLAGFMMPRTKKK